MADTTEIEILSPDENPQFASFDEREMKRWNSLKRSVNSYYDMLAGSRVNILTDEYWDALLKIAKNAKFRLGVGNFDGQTPQTGFGARPIIPEDVSSATADTATEWEAATITASRRSVWLGDNGGALYTAQYLAANTDITPRDVQDDKWGVALVGLIDYRNNAVIKSVSISQNGEHKGEYWVEQQLRSQQSALTSVALAELGEAAWFPPGFKFSAGLRARITVGPVAVAPIGLTFGTSLRIRRSAAGDPAINRGTRAS